jgi:phosphatidate cytidylyltransferase
VLPLIPPLPSLLPLLQSWFDTSLLDGKTLILLVAILLVLGVCWIGSRLLRRQPAANLDAAIIRTFDNRVSAWLTICLLLAVTMLFGRIFTVLFFFFVSFWALREFITMTPTRRGDHRTLFWVFFLFTPLQYVMVAFDWYQLYTIVIPVYASLFIPGRIAMTGDTKRFLERIAKIQFGLLICVYALSHAPALLYLKLQRLNMTSYEWEEWNGKPAGILLFFVIMVQVSDTLHFAWDRLFGKHVIAPTVNSTRTWEGIIGAAVGTAIAGMLIQLLLPVTPFTWYGAGIMAALISVMASSGSMTMSAIKRDRGVKDYGTLVQGHAGVLDRIDSVCFAAPIFFHVTRFFLERPETASEMARQLTGNLPF